MVTEGHFGFIEPSDSILIVLSNHCLSKRNSAAESNKLAINVQIIRANRNTIIGVGSNWEISLPMIPEMNDVGAITVYGPSSTYHKL